MYDHYYSDKTDDTERKTHIKFMKDMAIARLDETKLTPELRQEIVESMSHKTIVENGENISYRIEKLHTPLTPQELNKMIRGGVELRIGPHIRGRMHFVGDASWRKTTVNRARAFRVEFITD